MKFGIHSLLFSETFTERDLPLLDKAKAMGFDAMDIVPFDMAPQRAGRVLNASGKTLHGTRVEMKTVQ
jgi:sugar phosphate isomerase/epimerase